MVKLLKKFKEKRRGESNTQKVSTPTGQLSLACWR